MVFQSTCPRGARRSRCGGRGQRRDFNPRAHEGHDADSKTKSSALSHFNPRAHEGHDRIDPVAPGKLQISIHVPTRGTTPVFGRGEHQMVISIHVPTRGTTTDSSCPAASLDFNPRAHEGHDKRQIGCSSARVFQSTCPRGARHGISTVRDML